MADNIRSTVPTTFEAQDWQTPKIRATPGTATPDEIAHKVTAEWANAVDEAQREINKAFFGYPQQAVSVRGWVRGSNRSTTSGTTGDRTKAIGLVKNVPAAAFLRVELRLGVYRTGVTPGSYHRHEIALVYNNAGVFERKATELSTPQFDPADDLEWLDGSIVEFPESVSPATLAVEVTGPDSGESLLWIADFCVRNGPADLLEDSIVGI